MNDAACAVGASTIDLDALRTYRYARVQRLLRENNCAAALLINPINIRIGAVCI